MYVIRFTEDKPNTENREKTKSDTYLDVYYFWDESPDIWAKDVSDPSYATLFDTYQNALKVVHQLNKYYRTKEITFRVLYFDPEKTLGEQPIHYPFTV